MWCPQCVSAQLVCLGLLGEYIARIYEEAKGRPLYVFKQTPAASHHSATLRRGE